ncbi:hypothetical protein SAMN04489740_0964 [Arthrobacter alpinus]|uniref:Uncharacterized protein n=1 Tax=Arthrobacter alpinus TaxID=656366 RepID=A0A1H5HA82_9MICC|nr:hypothetical protein [Arthrobacter alpinus]SEE24775.1 hypothetical protein SAMN04489740_0964 [Arthrobacter alpinus]
MATNREASFKGLWIALILLVCVVASVSVGGGFLLSGIHPDDLKTGLTNIATLGGVTAGLSLAGAAILSLTGSAVHHLVERYGTWIRAILFGGYLVTIVASFVAGIGAVFATWQGAAWLASSSAAVIFAGLFVTALFINSAFKWHHSGPAEDLNPTA